jgi:hypothetical protein
MQTRPQKFALANMTAEEIAAFETADNVYGAEAKLEASKVLDTLQIEENSAMAVLGQLSLRLEHLDFPEKREVAEHFRRISEIVGSAVVPEQVHLVPVPVDKEPHEKSLPNAKKTEVTAEPHHKITDPEAIHSNEQDTTIETEAYKFDDLQKRFLSNLFGEHNMPAILGFSEGQFYNLLNGVGERYVNLSIKRLSKAAKVERRRQLMAFVFERQKSEEIAAPLGITSSAVTLGLRKFITSVHKRLEQSTLDSMVSAAKNEPATIVQIKQDSQEQAVAKTLEENKLPVESIPGPPTQPVTQERHEILSPENKVYEEPASLKQIVKSLGDILRFNNEELTYLKRLFDIEKRHAEISAEAIDVLETVQTLFGLTLNQEPGLFNSLERTAMELLLNNEKPMTVREVRSAMLEKLHINDIKIDYVLKTALAKLTESRKKVLTGERSLLVN